MPSSSAAKTTEGRRGRFSLISALFCLSLTLLGQTCAPAKPPPDDDPSPVSEIPAAPPLVDATLNGVLPPQNDLLVVPPSGFVINVGWVETDAPIDISSLAVLAEGWDGSLLILTHLFETDDVSNAWLVLQPPIALSEGSHTLHGRISDENGVTGTFSFSFAVREHLAGSPPIGTGQAIWFDFDADRDTTLGSDFDVDLEAFGLRSIAATAAQNAWVREWVIAESLERVRVAYYDSPTPIPGIVDPIDVVFSETDPSTPETTRICVGGEDPNGTGILGNVLLDYANSNRASVECATLPATGVFPREMLRYYTGQTAFQHAFDNLRPGAGGTAIGEHPYDGIVLAPDFDPLASGTPPTYVQRFIQIRNAVETLGASLGTILAHETGHALGLVPDGPPGGGLFGGGSGADKAHNLNPDGSKPAVTFLMNGGGQFSFAELAGAEGEPLAEFRPLNHAYLRDRVALDPSVSVLLAPPSVAAISPNLVNTTFQTVTITGEGFADTPALTLSNPTYTYHAIGEQFLSDTQMTAGIVRGQIPPGIYDLTVTNPDGQTGWLPQAITVE